jgi:hypothetical protein
MIVLAAAIAANAFLSSFGGTFACTEHTTGTRAPVVSHWTIEPAPESAWTLVHWQYLRDYGTAYVGYLAPLSQWTYEDFHSDGSFATSTSPGPQDGVWTWTTTYTTPQRVLHGAVQWKREGNGIRQGFGRLLGQSFRESASTTCRPVR